jgi:probable DNA metabolism protein
MHTVVYDGSFDGFLTTIFEIFEYKLSDEVIYREEIVPGNLFGPVHWVRTDLQKAQRVAARLNEKLSKPAIDQFYKTWLSEIHLIENSLFRFVKYVLASSKPVENNYAHPDVLMLQQTSRKVHREKHRMEAFVRFQLTGDGIYYSVIQPDFNVLPLIAKHFKDRYADQRWLIYDVKRKYGLYYDLNEVTDVQLRFEADLNNPAEKSVVFDEKEELYQRLWQQYFSSVNIAARKNMKLHVQHMPRRYWKNLIEKQPTK